MTVLDRLVHTHVLYPWTTNMLRGGTLIVSSARTSYGRMARYGAQFGDLVGSLVEALDPAFACADLGGLWALMQTRLRSIRSPATWCRPVAAPVRFCGRSPPGCRRCWRTPCPHMKRLLITEQMRARIDPFELAGI